ncbi:guanylate kinase [Polluticaenibacter yanchengensis]|uniref:Guanylate kinase n=1 Tax=Polluticaenibacter yanchengensis TaxID=3014562 RepID=A0ABT4UNI6_9BACT|nr:guanylate kinase [Chitinophagaceae bacterium LY-5]
MENITGKIIMLTAPSGAGKTSITKYLLQDFPQLSFSVSAATRKPRGNEVNGKDYYFMSEDEFKQKIADEEFVEWEMVYEGNYYGTLKSEIYRMWKEGLVPVLDIDVKGAIHVSSIFGKVCLSLFIQAPSIDELRKRLESRNTDSKENIDIRINKASYELSFKDKFDAIIINDDLAKAQQQAKVLVERFLE